ATYTLAILITGRGDAPPHRSHWSFTLFPSLPPSPPTLHLATLLEVTPLSLTPLIYTFSKRTGADILPLVSEGYVVLTCCLTREEAKKAEGVIEKEKAPRNGTDRCQEWVVDCVVGLEVEGLVADGVSALVGSCVGKTSEEVERDVGWRWVGRER
ncbi:uncharacterized protein EI97DRAFT_346634, partial [Westerdykella ornata]